MYTQRIFLLFMLVMWSPISLTNALPDKLHIDEFSVEWGGVPRDPFVDMKGDVWFCGQAGNYIARFNPQTKQFRRYELSEGTHPHNLIVDTKGRVWYAGNRNGHIGAINPESGAIQTYAMPTGVSDPHTLVFDEKENIWFTAQHSNVIGFLNTQTGVVQSYPLTTPKSRPYGIKITKEGVVWSVLLGTNKLAVMDTNTRVLREISLLSAEARPRRLEISEDGRVWYVDYSRGYLGVFNPEKNEFKEWLMPGGKDSKPYATVMDNHGVIWISETGTYPNAMVGFDTKSAKFISHSRVKADGSIRHMYFDGSRQAFWFGIDSGVIARASPK